jgi:hypothetical protein
VGVQRVHDPERAGDDERDDEDAESERQHVISVIRVRADMQEENKMRPMQPHKRMAGCARTTIAMAQTRKKSDTTR